jgi:hypothetical protein
MGLFQQRRSGIGTSILFGVGGLLVGAGIAAAFTPVTGNQLRKLLLELLDPKSDTKLDEGVDNQLDRMENEGGVSHDVAPSISGAKAYESHS